MRWERHGTARASQQGTKSGRQKAGFPINDIQKGVKFNGETGSADMLRCTGATSEFLRIREIPMMSVKKKASIVALALLWSAFGLGTAVAATSVTNADELVTQHLDSIASSTVRAGIKTRVAQAPVRYTILVGGAGVVDGKAFLVSDGKKLQFMMKLPNTEYRGEQFVFDGDKDKVAFSTAGQSRSSLGSFVFVQDAVIREG